MKVDASKRKAFLMWGMFCSVPHQTQDEENHGIRMLAANQIQLFMVVRFNFMRSRQDLNERGGNE